MGTEKIILSEYGTVRTCKVVKDQVVTIVLTDGFKEDYMKTFSFIAKCTELFPEYPNMVTCITEKDLAIIVLTK